jgi:hypothetical protein
MAFFTLDGRPSLEDEEVTVQLEEPASEGTRQRQVRTQRRALTADHDHGRVEEEMVAEDFQKYTRP